MDLTSPAQISALMERHGLRFKKRLGQNFLCNRPLLEKLAEATGIIACDDVLEIGPGAGALTAALAGRAGRVVAVEIDRSLEPLLEEVLTGYENVRVVYGDFLGMDDKQLAGYFCGGPFHVAANLPYYITTPVIFRLLESRLDVRSITVMVQKEVAQRIVAQPGTKDYGALSVMVQYRCEPRVALKVPAGAFLPRPNVDSAVVHMRMQKRLEAHDEELFARVVRAAFAMRRKTLENNLAAAFELSRADCQAALVRAGVAPRARGETLGIPEFVRLTAALAGFATRG